MSVQGKSRGARERTRRAATVLVLAAAMFILGVGADEAQASRLLNVRAVVGAPRQEPGARVPVRVIAVDQRGRALSGVLCSFTWHLSGVTRHGVATTGPSGIAATERGIGDSPGGFRVWVTVVCRWRGQLARCKTSFVVQRAIPATPHVVFVGDSLTVGLYAETEAATFRAVACSQFACTWRILGANGGQSKDVDLAGLSAAEGDIVVIELGTNDANGYPDLTPVRPATFEQNVRAIAAAARSGRPDSRLVFLTVWQSRPTRTPYDARIRAVAADFGRHVVDISPLKDDPSLCGPAGLETFLGLSDAWHPNSAGHAAIGARTGGLIVRLLATQGTADVP